MEAKVKVKRDDINHSEDRLVISDDKTNKGEVIMYFEATPWATRTIQIELLYSIAQMFKNKQE